jgi:hypothetical protein
MGQVLTDYMDLVLAIVETVVVEMVAELEKTLQMAKIQDVKDLPNVVE